jgi:hypothetical protein
VDVDRRKERQSMLRLGLFVAAAALTGIVFFALYRPWQLRWGSTGEEVARGMPGNEVVRAPTFSATRAVTIEERPEAVWPWIVQIGFGRAGWYSSDVLDNLGHHSAERIIPKLQHIEVGDLIPVGSVENAGMRIKAFEPNRWVLWSEPNQLTTWIWSLEPIRGGQTRLITRVRSRSSWHHPATAVWLLVVEVTDFPMMRKCLLGIKRRAEAGVLEKA